MRYLAAFSLTLLLSPLGAWAQEPPDRATQPSTLVVMVRTIDGQPLLSMASVRLFSMFATVNRQSTTIDGGRASFPGVPVGEYRVEVLASGYERAEEDAQVLAPGTTAFVTVTLRPEGSAAPARPSGPPLLAPKARREFEKGSELLKAGKVTEAIEHLERAFKMAPAFPDVCYLLGVAYQRANRQADARTYLEKTISLDPNHQGALNSLAVVFVMVDQHAKALEMLERSLRVAPDSANTLWILSMVRMRMGEHAAALEHVDKAIQLAAGMHPEMYVLRGQLLESMGRWPEAIAQWEEVVTNFPNRTEAASARQRLERARNQQAAVAKKTVVKPTPSDPPMVTPIRAVAEEASNLTVEWAPPEIDSARLHLEPGVACPAADVLMGARRQAAALVESLQSFTATETVQRRVVDARAGAFAEWVYEYQALIEQPRPGRLAVSDFRVAKSGGSDPSLKNNGIPAMALIMHPFYADDFMMQCEGRAMLAGQSAWIVSFRQRDDKQARIRSYGIQGRRFSVRLKGRAWISANSGNVIRLETDLLKPIPELKLTRDHMVIDYAPVRFEKRNVRLWLPAAVNLYTDVDGKRRHYLHLYDSFELFAVDTKYQIEQKQAPAEGPPN